MANSLQFGNLKLEFTGSALNIKKDSTTLLAVNSSTGEIDTLKVSKFYSTGVYSTPYDIISGDSNLTNAQCGTIMVLSEGSKATVRLPDNPVEGMIFTIKSIDELGQAIGIDGNGRDIEGNSTYDLTNANDSVVLQYCAEAVIGGEWKILASHTA